MKGIKISLNEKERFPLTNKKTTIPLNMIGNNFSR
jgi:hypothetical protein